MTFLELANRLLSEADISGNGLTTTANQSGEYRQAVNYINTAYEDIQSTHPRWNFLRRDLAFDTIASVSNYYDTSIDLDDFGEWLLGTMRIYLASDSITTERHLIPVDWDHFRDTFLFGSARTQVGRPTHITIKPDNSLCVYPIPDDHYKIIGEYYREPFTLVLDTDRPVFPPRFQMIIVWRALMFFATKLNAQELFAIGNAEYRRIMFKLEQFNLPQNIAAGSL